MDLIEEDLLNIGEDFLGGDPILSDAQMQLITSELFNSGNNEESNFNMDYQDDLDRLICDLQEIEEFQCIRQEAVSANFQKFAKTGEFSGSIKDIDERISMDSFENIIRFPTDYSNQESTQENSSSNGFKVPVKESKDLFKVSIILHQEPSSLNQRQKLIDSCVGRQTSHKPPCDPRKRKILKPLMKTDVYSKIPDYYTSIACATDKLKSANTGNTSACKENVYDKLPSYLTDFTSTKNVETSVNILRNRTKQKEESEILEIFQRSSKVETKQSEIIDEKKVEEEEKKLVDERRVVHVGNIKRGTTREQLYTRFKVFGPIEDIKLHYRDHGDCYAFITFQFTTDAFDALENGNNVNEPQYELSLGGRRLFCLQQYADLDLEASRYGAQSGNKRPKSYGREGGAKSQQVLSDGDEKVEAVEPNQMTPDNSCDDFDTLLKAAKDNMSIRNRK